MKLSPELNLGTLFPEISEDQWRALVERDLRGAPFEKRLITHTYEGLRILPLYTAAHAPDPMPSRAGFGGLTRGANVLGLSQCGWDLRQERAEPTPESVNEALRDDLLHGVTSVLLRFDAAARGGLDADDPMAARLIGEDGAALYTLADLRDAFDEVHLSMIGVAHEAGAAFLPAAALTVSLLREQNVDLATARVAFNADPLAVLARDGRLPQSLENAYAQMLALARWTAEHCPRGTSIRVGSAPYHHAGASAAQDLAFSMATGIEYLRVLTGGEMDLADAAKQMQFSYAVGCNFFLAACKLRAARQLWRRVVAASGGDGADAAGKMSMHVRTSKRVLTTRDPWVNLLRNTACVFAAAVGGADVVTSTPLDQAIGLPSGRSRRIARNTATIVAEESHLLRVADPAGGSWFIERLTSELAEKAWVILQTIESHGGMLACLKSGWVAEQLSESSSARERNITTRRDAILGVSEFPHLEEEAVETPETSRAAVIGAARKRLYVHRAAFQPDAALAKLSPPTAEAAAVMPAALEAVQGGASLGELAARVFAGEPETIEAPIVPHPYARSFEALRSASDEHQETFGFRPRVFLAQIGTPAEFNARSGFSKGFFEAGGFEVIASGQIEIGEAPAAFAGSAANIAVICSTDERYASVVSELAPRLHEAGARTVILAGNPGDHEAHYRAAGVDRFIFIKCDVLGTLRDLLGEEGVLA